MWGWTVPADTQSGVESVVPTHVGGGPGRRTLLAYTKADTFGRQDN